MVRETKERKSGNYSIQAYYQRKSVQAISLKSLLRNMTYLILSHPACLRSVLLDQLSTVRGLHCIKKDLLTVVSSCSPCATYVHSVLITMTARIEGLSAQATTAHWDSSSSSIIIIRKV